MQINSSSLNNQHIPNNDQLAIKNLQKFIGEIKHLTSQTLTSDIFNKVSDLATDLEKMATEKPNLTTLSKKVTELLNLVGEIDPEFLQDYIEEFSLN